MTSPLGKQIIAIHLLSNISRSKGYQKMKFGQLLEYNMRHFIEKSYTVCGQGTSQRLFSKNSKLSISEDQLS